MEALNQDEAFEPGNVLRDTAAALGGWQAAHQASLSPREWDELDEREIKLLNSASSMYTGAAGGGHIRRRRWNPGCGCFAGRRCGNDPLFLRFGWLIILKSPDDAGG